MNFTCHTFYLLKKVILIEVVIDLREFSNDRADRRCHKSIVFYICCLFNNRIRYRHSPKIEVREREREGERERE
jgi:hypothetical protein